MYNVEEIGLRLKGLREEKGLSQSKLAEQLEITRETVTRYELGKRLISVDMLDLYSKYFDVSTDYIMYGTVEKMKICADYQEIARLLADIPDNKKELVYGMVKGMLSAL